MEVHTRFAFCKRWSPVCESLYVLVEPVSVGLSEVPLMTQPRHSCFHPEGQTVMVGHFLTFLEEGL